MLGDGSTNVRALTPVIALLAVFCFSVGRMLSRLVPTLMMSVPLIVLHAIKRERLAIKQWKPS